MASRRGQNHDRGFREAVLGRCFVQTCIERFGYGAHEIIRQRERDHLNHIETENIIQGIPVGQIYTGSPQDGDDTLEPPLEKRIPRMPYFRNNLTALSQRYNLYFAAYENRIFVYRPKSVPKHALPREPNLILATRPDKVAVHISGTLDARFHHQANSITTGFLGREEVLVSAYDDGSVFAWYIEHIANYVDHASSDCHCQVPVPTCFFTDNVGKSAWGLAVHQNSRLIAVSSNRFEVTVFAFGLSRLPGALERRSRSLDHYEKSVLERKRNWRIVIPLGDGAHNIPNIALWDDDEGFAEKVVAIDINGTVWVMDIWKTGTAALKIPHRANVAGQWRFHNPRGWGVAVIPFESFLPAYNVTDLLGLRESDIMNAKPPHVGRWIEVQRSLSHIRNHPSGISAQDVPEPEAFAVHNNAGWAALTEGEEAGDMMMAALFAGPALFLPPAPAQPPNLEDDFIATMTVPFHSTDEDIDDVSSEENEVAGEEDADEAALAALVSSDSAEEDDNDENEDDDDENEDDDDSFLDVPDFIGLDQFNAPLSDMAGLEDDIVFIEEAIEAANEDAGPVNVLTAVMPPDGICNFIKSSLGARDRGMMLQSSWLDLVYFPHSSKTYVIPTSVVGRLQFHRRERISNRNTTPQDRGILEELGRRCCILRTYEEDIEMRSINQDDGAAVFCRDPIRWNQPHNQLLQHAERLNMIVHVPELSLVVIGSAIGRVILLTPTRSPYGLLGGGFTVKNGYRIDWVLPTRDDDEAGRRPPRGLYGIAVGPVPESGAPGCLLRSDDALAPSPALRRYRLILHYRDHRILSYDIGRDERGEHLLIF